ncbi:MAG: VRR-NUC domain-containing protein [Cyclobacteriaceae bacterium]
MSEATARPKVILPEKYYLDYFRYVISFIRQMYPTMLGEQEEFLKSFEALSESAQCLYLRINGRKGWYFRPSKLSYQEIADMESTVQELLDTDFVRLADEEDLPEMVTPIFTKQELHDWLKEQGIDPLPRKSAPRPEIGQAVLAHFEIERFQDYDQVIAQEQLAHMEIIKIMFFGNPYGDFNQFVVRDVGNVKMPHQKSDNFKPFFENRAQIDQQWQILQWYREFKLLVEEEVEAMAIWEWLEDKVEVFETLFDTSRVISDKFLFRAGQYFEKQQALEEASKLYGWSSRPEANERKLRVLIKLKNDAAAIEYAQWLSSDGPNANLKLLGTDYLKKQGSGKAIRSTTHKIKAAQVVEVTYSQETRIERLVLDHLEDQGYSGFFSENYIWRSLFGLVFWDQLYAEDAIIHQPLQRLPSDIYAGFYETRKEELLAHLSNFRSKTALKKWITQKFDEVEGEGNPFVFWHSQLKSNIECFLQWMKATQVKAVLLEMSKNPKENCTGFPDLFVYSKSEYYFYEVKSPNDHLSAQQLFWIDFFEEHSINVDILRTK